MMGPNRAIFNARRPHTAEDVQYLPSWVTPAGDRRAGPVVCHCAQGFPVSPRGAKPIEAIGVVENPAAAGVSLQKSRGAVTHHGFCVAVRRRQMTP